MENLSGKVVIVGDPSVGKTSIVERWSGKTFESNYRTTIGADFKTFRIQSGDDTVCFKLWDIAGSDRFKSMSTLFYRDSDIILVVYDMSNPNSFTNIREWLRHIKEHINNHPSFWLIGNKSDLVSNIDDTFIKVYCEESGFDASYFVSAKTYHNLDVLMNDVGKEIKARAIEKNKILERVQTVNLNNKLEQQKSKCSC